MGTFACTNPKNSTFVPVVGLSFFAIASGFLMSLIPLSLESFGLSLTLTPWLASIFYLGLLIGSLQIESVVARIGHRLAFILFLSVLLLSIFLMISMPNAATWLASRFIAGIAVAGVFVVVESWLLMADTAKQRAKRLGLYMTSLYGGNALGQLGLVPIGVEGIFPYSVVIGVLLIAILPPLLIKVGQPDCSGHQKIKLAELRTLSRPAILGCLVSGMLMAPIYGLMPLYIKAQTGSAEQTGMLMAIIILGGMLVQPIVSYLSPKMSKTLLMSLFCLVGVLGVIGILTSRDSVLLSSSYMLLGASVFSLYPVAISLACDNLSVSKIVAATEIMLLSYSAGSVAGPAMAQCFKQYHNGLIMYLGVCMLTMCIYMLIKSATSKPSDHSAIPQ
ncbi:MAG: MFS transporter [Moritella sp.]|uniref:MFS transporter n=1 Tax=Moritella sp. TaxID=78556 RepID=UPI0029B3DA55|nr:MFS transporter [Moritella sp.]MDX2319485.1 MFS transporter [Moritella sp.]